MNEIKRQEPPKDETPKRFPGVAPFQDDYIASELFYGRELESQKLLHYILAEHLVVMFSYSGYGKTSLLHASVFKRLREKGYYPLTVRFNKKGHTPTEIIRSELLAISEDGKNEIILDLPAESSLVDIFKKLEIWSSDDKLLIPVVVFDQFEEIFTLEHNQKHLNNFFLELSQLLKYCQENGSDVKMLFSLREDFLGHLEKMAVQIPSVFTNRFRLEALEKSSAESAIIEPARKVVNNVKFSSQSFFFSDDAKQELLNFLSLKRIEGHWLPSNEIEPIQLQIICSELENRIIKGMIKSKHNGDILIQVSDFNGKEGLQEILANFYDKQIFYVIRELKLTREQVYYIKELIETKLISGNRRVPLAYDSIISSKGVNKEAIDLLIAHKLLKIESHHENSLVEISHDTLVEPILNSLKLRKEREARQKKKMQVIKISSIATALLLLIGTFASLIFKNLKASSEKYYIAAIMAARENPTLGYKIASRSQSNMFRELVKDLDTSGYSFIVKRFTAGDNILSAFVSSNNNDIALIDKSGIHKWELAGNFKGSILFEKEPIMSGYSNDYFAVQYEDSKLGYNLRDSKGGSFRFPEDSVISFMKNFKPGSMCSFIQDQDTKIMYSPDRAYYIMLSGNKITLRETPFMLLDSLVLNADSLVLYGKERDAVSNENVSWSQKKQNLFSALTVCSDFKHLIYATVTGSANIVPFDIENHRFKINYNGITKLKGLNSRIDHIAMSPGDSLILTSGIDNIACLYNMKGERMSLLKGHQSKITYVNFSPDSKLMITADEQGNVFIWKQRKDMDNIIKEKDLANFTPFEYRSFGLEDKEYSAKKMYSSDTSVARLFFNAIHYSTSIPLTNRFPEDHRYAQSLDTSIREINMLYEMLFYSRIFRMQGNNYKKFAYNKYIRFTLRTPQLINERVQKADPSVAKNINSYYEWRIKSRGAQTFSITDSLNLLDTLNKLADYFTLVKNYTETIHYYKRAIEEYKRLKIDDPNKYNYKFLSFLFEKMSHFQIINKEYRQAIESMQEALKIDPENNESRVKLILAYCLNYQFQKAHNYTIANAEPISTDDFMDDQTILEYTGTRLEENARLFGEIANLKVVLLNHKIRIDSDSVKQKDYSTDSQSYQTELSSSYGSLAYWEVCIGKYKEAITHANRGLRISPNNNWIITNLALGYLLDNQFNQANKIYATYKDSSYSDQSKTFKEAFLQDLNVLLTAKRITKNDIKVYKQVEDIKEMLSK